MELIAEIVTDSLRTALLDYARDHWDFLNDRPRIAMCPEFERAVRSAIRESREADNRQPVRA